MAAKKFPAKTPDEKKLCTFDIGPELADGAVPANPVVEKFLVSGSDTGAAALTLGTPTLDGNVVVVLVGGGISGCKYKLRAQLDDSNNGERHQVDGILKVSESAG